MAVSPALNNHTVLSAGHPMGPFQLLDYVGLDTTSFITHGWARDYPVSCGGCLCLVHRLIPLLTRLHARAHMHSHPHTHTRTHTHTHAHTHAHTHTRTHAHTHTRTHTYTHIHTRDLACLLPATIFPCHACTLSRCPVRMLSSSDLLRTLMSAWPRASLVQSLVKASTTTTRTSKHLSLLLFTHITSQVQVLPCTQP